MTFWDAFSRTASRKADHAALVTARAEWTFQQWHGRARDYAGAYLEAGVAVGDRVLVHAESSTETAAAIAGVWAVGGIAALIDSGAPRAHVDHAIATISPRLRVCADPARVPEDLPVRMLSPDTVTPYHGTGAFPAPAATDPGLIDFTSGSTGKPKAVVHGQDRVLRANRAVAASIGLREDDRLLCPVPWAFSYGSQQLCFSAFMGVTLIAPGASSPFAVCEAIARHRPTVIAGLPALYTFLLRGVSPVRQTDLASVRLLVNTGGAIPRPIVGELLELFGSARLSLNYGLTESYRSSSLPPDLVAEHPDSIGKPIPGVDLVVLREDGTAAKPGEEGEIVHRGDFLALGYWNDPEATARVFRPDPLAAPGTAPSRCLFTGDFGHRGDGGLLYFHGRRDHQIKSNGVRVSPGEVEHLLHESGLVRAAAVFGMPHDLMGHEVWAAVVPKEANPALRSLLDQFSRSVMSSYMQPRRWLIRDSLPQTPNGKTDYPALRVEAARAPSASLAAGR